MRRALLIVAGVMFALLPSVVSAGPACVPGPVTSITNTSCSIGSLTFNFENMTSVLYTYYFTGGAYTWVDEPLDKWSFTPVTNGLSYGFTISGDTFSTGTPPLGARVENYAFLRYSMESTNRLPIIVGTSASGGTLSFNGTSGRAYGYNVYTFLTFTSGLFVNNQASYDTATGSSSALSSSFAPESGTRPFSVFGVGKVQTDGDYQVDWSGASTMMFETTAVPDPASTLLLLGMSVTGLVAAKRRWRR